MRASRLPGAFYGAKEFIAVKPLAAPELSGSTRRSPFDPSLILGPLLTASPTTPLSRSVCPPRLAEAEPGTPTGALLTEPYGLSGRGREGGGCGALVCSGGTQMY